MLRDPLRSQSPPGSRVWDLNVVGVPPATTCKSLYSVKQISEPQGSPESSRRIKAHYPDESDLEWLEARIGDLVHKKDLRTGLGLSQAW